eukprot:15456772-Alexandrium_andersonii.AAC.1
MISATTARHRCTRCSWLPSDTQLPRACAMCQIVSLDRVAYARLQNFGTLQKHNLWRGTPVAHSTR